MNTAHTANEMKLTLQQFNKGVKSVVLEQGVFCVYVSSARAAYGVTLDLLRSRAFRSVTKTENCAGKGFIVHAIPAQC